MELPLFPPRVPVKNLGRLAKPMMDVFLESLRNRRPIVRPAKLRLEQRPVVLAAGGQTGQLKKILPRTGTADLRSDTTLVAGSNQHAPESLREPRVGLGEGVGIGKRANRTT